MTDTNQTNTNQINTCQSTPMTANLLTVTAMREGAARQYPLGGIQSAEQVADVMAFLLGDGAARLTGQAIAVDGYLSNTVKNSIPITV
jgi:enoyl-[acyl-carrier-protein] reductase (NADH)